MSDGIDDDEKKMRKGDEIENFEKKEEACMKLLRGDVDEEKLSGLLLSAKYLLPAGKRSTRKRVYAAAGKKFFDRLARTKKMRHVFLAVMCNLLVDPSVAKEYENKGKMFLDFTVNAARLTKESDELAVKTFSDAVACLEEISKRVNLVSNGVVQYTLYILWILKDLKGKLREIASKPCQRLAALLVNQLGTKKHWNNNTSKKPSAMFCMAAELFQSYEPPIKWDLLCSLPLILRFENDPEVLDDEDVKKRLLESQKTVKWESCIRNGIQAVWVVRNLPANLRSRCFELSTILTSSTSSIRWACESDSEKKENRGKFLNLWISLAANELKIYLDNVVEAMETATLKRESFNMDELKDDNLALLLMQTLSMAVRELCSEEGDFVLSEFVSSSSLLSILRVLRQSNEMIFGFLTSYLQFLQDTSIKTTMTRLSALADECMRTIGQYMLEDTDETIVSVFSEILPKLCDWKSNSLQYILPVLNERKELLNLISTKTSDNLFLQLLKMIPDIPIDAARLCIYVAHELIQVYKTEFKRETLKHHEGLIRSTMSDGSDNTYVSNFFSSV